MIRLYTDSVAGIPAELAQNLGINVISLYFNDGITEFQEVDMDVDAFYDHIAEMADNPPKSSQPSQATFMNLFEDAAKAGDEVLGVFLSSKLSGTFDGAIRAARGVAAHHLNFHAAFVDSLSAGYDEAFVAMAAARAVREGKSLIECAEYAHQFVVHSRYFFATESLTFLKKGGRIGAGAALLGNALKLIPIFTVRDGLAYVDQKIRTFKRAGNAMFDKFFEDAETRGLLDVSVHYIGGEHMREAARKLCHEKVEPYVGHDVPIIPTSPVLGLHVGPAIGIAYSTEMPLEGKITELRDSFVLV